MLWLTQEIGKRLLERLDFIKMKPLVLLNLVNLDNGSEIFNALLQKKYPNAVILNIVLNAFVTLKNQSVDCIFLNCELPWDTDLSSFFTEIKRVLKPEGIFLFSSFGPDTLKELSACVKKTDTKMPIDVFIDMHDIGDALIQLEFSDPVLDVEHIEVQYQNVQDLLNDVQNSKQNLFIPIPNTLSKEQLIKQYEVFRKPSGILPATFEIIYGLAWNIDSKNHIPIKII